TATSLRIGWRGPWHSPINTPFRNTSAESSAATVRREFQIRGGVRNVLRKNATGGALPGSASVQSHCGVCPASRTAKPTTKLMRRPERNGVVRRIQEVYLNTC